MNKESPITTKKSTRHLGKHKNTNTTNNQLDRKVDHTHTNVVKRRSY